MKIGLSMCQWACRALPPQLHDQALIILPEGRRILIRRCIHRLNVETRNLLAANSRTWTALEDAQRYASGHTAVYVRLYNQDRDLEPSTRAYGSASMYHHDKAAGCESDSGQGTLGP